jgi:S1-C subfamily serine protease
MSDSARTRSSDAHEGPAELRSFRHPAAPRAAPAATRWLALLLLAVAAALVVTVLGQDREQRAPTPEPRTITPRGDLAADELSTIELFHEISPSVVHITRIETQRSQLTLNPLEVPRGVGSGIVWDHGGHIVTNHHVISGAQRAEITLNDNTVWPAQVIGEAPDKDIAVLKIEAPKERLRPIPLGTSGNLQVGQRVFVIGNPFGLDQTLTTGVISGLGREIRAQTSLQTQRPIRDVIQTDAAINPGNSGGPLLDSAGRLIGVNTAIYSPSGTHAGIGFAVPVDTVNRIVPQLIAEGKIVHPGLGIEIATDQIARQFQIQGVVVWHVPRDSAAGRAGLEGLAPGGPGGGWVLGDIIVGLEGEPIRSTSDLYGELERHEVNDTVTLEILRGSERRQLNVTLQALP